MKMLRQLLIGVTPLLLVAVGCGNESPIRDQNGATIGTIRVDQSTELRLIVTIDLVQAPQGEHGIHLHTTGTCEATANGQTEDDFQSAGLHFNPSNTLHGDPDLPVHHAGDFGNISVGPDGRGSLALTTTFLSLDANAANSAIGRSVILYAGRDDLTAGDSTPNYSGFPVGPGPGSPANRIGCGVVR
jgi:Cu-Zn family superoxide dismutase